MTCDFAPGLRAREGVHPPGLIWAMSPPLIPTTRSGPLITQVDAFVSPPTRRTPHHPMSEILGLRVCFSRGQPVLPQQSARGLRQADNAVSPEPHQGVPSLSTPRPTTMSIHGDLLEALPDSGHNVCCQCRRGSTGRVVQRPRWSRYWGAILKGYVSAAWSIPGV